MNIKEYAYEKDFNTPAYFFDLLEFHNCCKLVKQSLGNIPLTYSIKANPFLLYDLFGYRHQLILDNHLYQLYQSFL